MAVVATLWGLLFLDAGVVANNEKATLWVKVPSVVAPGEEFDVHVQAWDAYERLAGEYDGEVSFSLESYAFDKDPRPLDPGSVAWWVSEPVARFTSNFVWRGAKAAYQVPGADNGHHVTRARVDTPGLHYLVVTEVATGRRYWSNPFLVNDTWAASSRVYWGDIHGHSYYSDGSGSPADVYRFGRDVALLDFMALTDHAEAFPTFVDADPFGKFAKYQATTNAFNDPGRFATLVAMEWTPLFPSARRYLAPGHVNVYVRGSRLPYFSSFAQTDPDALYAHLRAKLDGSFLAWSHHTTRADYLSDFAYYDPQVNTMIEVYSCHGSSEFAGDEGDWNLFPMVHEVDRPGFSVADLLRMGRRCGLMASSDGHDGRMGHFIGHTRARTLATPPFTLTAYQYGVPYPGGLTAVLAANLSREATFDALRNRAAYASTSVRRPLLLFSVNGVTPGVDNSTAFVDDASAPRFVELFVAADGLAVGGNAGNGTAIRRVKVFKNSEPWRAYQAPAGQRVAWLSFSDASEVTGTSYDHCVEGPDGRWYVHDASKKPVDPATLNTGGADYYYARVVDSDGGAAWVGPVWVSPT
ncbi:MAG: hypothetical protein Kow0069_31570 [Promethearchaeota archaeon]